MACIRPDGSLTEIGRLVLGALKSFGTREEAASATGLPLYRVRMVARALEEVGLTVEAQGKFVTTPAGDQKLASSSVKA